MESTLNKLKLKLHILNKDIVSDKKSIEVDESISVRALKKNIQSSYNLGRVQLFHNDKDLKEFEKSKLCDLFTTRERCNTELNINVVPRKIKSSNKVARKKKRYKYMLACNKHNRENAHYFCFACKLSFCTLCLAEHDGHQYIDKYEYSKSSEELVNGIMENFIDSIKRLEEDNKTSVFSNLLNSAKNERILEDSKETKVLYNNIEDLRTTFSEFSNIYKTVLRDKSCQKIEDFKEHLLKYKSICLTSISKNFNKNEVVILEEEHFLELNKTINELHLGKEALIAYMDTLNKKFEEEKNHFYQFSNEIADDIKTVANKIKNKIKSLDNNYSQIDEQRLSNLKLSNFGILEPYYEEDSQMQSKYISESELSTSMSLIDSRYIMKRRLSVNSDPEIILYDTANKNFQVRKIKTSDKLFKNFLEFSVFINMDNMLYISGGKTKKGQHTSDFFSFNSYSDELVRLPNMLKERCSHSMSASLYHIYAIGGYNNNTTERFCLKTNKWEKLPDLNCKERQVPTVFIHDNKFIICIFGYLNNYAENFNDEYYYERLNLEECTKWELIKLRNNFNKVDLRIFNVGIIPIDSGKYLICGGEQYKGEESDNIYLLNLDKNLIKNYDSLKMPTKCSFIDKNFVKYSKNKFAQYEMKRNNLIIFDSTKCKFVVKNF
jgi:gas vesicle protein